MATGTTTHIGPRITGSIASGETAFFDNISVREVTGIAASQPTTSNKPILRRGALNLLLNNGGTPYYPNGGGGSVIAVTPQGAGVTKIEKSGSGGFAEAFCRIEASNGVPISATSCCQVRIISGNAADISFGMAQDNIPFVNVSSTLTSLGVVADGSWYDIAKAGTLTTSSSQLRSAYFSYQPTTASVIEVRKPALFQGTYTAAQIQSLGGIPLTTTAPASTALGAHFWQFDGSNDSLSLGGPLFQMADDHCVIAGAKLDAFSVARIIYSQRNTGNTFPIVGQLQVAADGSVNAYYRNNENTQSELLASAGGVIAIGTPFVLTETKTGSSCYIEVNNSTVATAVGTLPSTGTFVINAAAIGASTENGNNPMAGALYLIVMINGSVSEAEKLLLKRFVGQLSGVQI